MIPGWWFQPNPLKKWWSSSDWIIIPNLVGENICSKITTSWTVWLWIFFWYEQSFKKFSNPAKSWSHKTVGIGMEPEIQTAMQAMWWPVEIKKPPIGGKAYLDGPWD